MDGQMLSRYCDWKYTDLHELEQVNFMMSCMMSYFEGAGNDHSPHKDFRTCHRGWRAMLLHHHGCHTPRPTLRCWDPPQDPLWGHRWQSEATASQMVVHLMLSSGDLWSAPSLVRLRTDSELSQHSSHLVITGKKIMIKNDDQILFQQFHWYHLPYIHTKTNEWQHTNIWSLTFFPDFCHLSIDAE